MSSFPPASTTRELLERIRASLPSVPMREVRMFGTLAVMLDDAMVVALGKDGSLLVRVDPAEDAQLVMRPHARRAEMGAGRSMGPSWVRVDAAGIATDEALGDWIESALRHWRRQSGRSAAPSGPGSRTPTA